MIEGYSNRDVTSQNLKWARGPIPFLFLFFLPSIFFPDLFFSFFFFSPFFLHSVSFKASTVSEKLRPRAFLWPPLIVVQALLLCHCGKEQSPRSFAKSFDFLADSPPLTCGAFLARVFQDPTNPCYR